VHWAIDFHWRGAVIDGIVLLTDGGWGEVAAFVRTQPGENIEPALDKLVEIRQALDSGDLTLAQAQAQYPTED